MSFFEIVIFYEFLNSGPQILNLPPASYLASNVGKRRLWKCGEILAEADYDIRCNPSVK